MIQKEEIPVLGRQVNKTFKFVIYKDGYNGGSYLWFYNEQNKKITWDGRKAAICISISELDCWNAWHIEYAKEEFKKDGIYL